MKTQSPVVSVWMQPGVLKVSQEYRGMSKSKCCQLRQFVFIPAWRSNLLHHTEFAIFFWCLLKHSPFSVAPYWAPKQSPSSIVSTVPTWSSPDHRGRVVCVSVWACFGAHTLTPSSILFGDLAPSDSCLLSATTVISSLFLPFQYFSILKKKSNKETCVWSSLYLPGSILGSGRSPGGGNGNPLQYSCLENPMDRGAWWAIAYGVTKSWTWLSTWAQGSFAPHRPCILKL